MSYYLNIIDKLTVELVKQIDVMRERLKQINVEIKSIKTMLEKTLTSWTKYNELFESVEKWLIESENKKNLEKVKIFL